MDYKERRNMRAELDSLWSLAVKNAFGHRCALTGAVGTDAHHLLRRGITSGRWVVINGVCLSRNAHDWAHRNELRFMRWLEEALPNHWRAYNDKVYDYPLSERDVDLATVKFELQKMCNHIEQVFPIASAKGIPPSIIQ